MKPCNVGEATHVKFRDQLHKIAEKWGIDAGGHLAPPSHGGFGVVTTTGIRVDMWQAESYWVEE